MVRAQVRKSVTKRPTFVQRGSQLNYVVGGIRSRLKFILAFTDTGIRFWNIFKVLSAPAVSK